MKEATTLPDYMTIFMTEEESSILRTVVGQFNWVASQSRPGSMFEVCQLSAETERCRYINLEKSK